MQTHIPQNWGDGDYSCAKIFLVKHNQMRFGELLLRKSKYGWRYLDYERLKKNINSRVFAEILKTDIDLVDAFFEENVSAQTYEYAALNYIAVLKILKKHKKVTGNDATPMQQSSFASALRSGHLAVKLLECSFCPICYSDSNASAQLPCGHTVCFQCMRQMNAFSIEACPMCRSFLHDDYSSIDRILGQKSPKYYPTRVSAAFKTSQAPNTIRIMSWNLCAFAYPLNCSFLRFVSFLFLTGNFISDSTDVPLYLNADRVRQQALFISSANADVVLIQEAVDEQGIQSLAAMLPQFKLLYRTTDVSRLNYVLYMACLCTVSCTQALVAGFGLRLDWRRLFIPFVLWTACRWRSSTLYAFLLGRVQGQLAILSKTQDMDPTLLFDTFSFVPSNAYLSTRVMQYLRPRGVLRYVYRGIDIFNTHFPHGVHDQSYFFNVIKDLCRPRATVIGGDFNPHPCANNNVLFAPLREAGIVQEPPKHITWNLEEPLTRKTDSTPRDMQLDYILHSRGKSEYTTLPTKVSDHYGLVCEFAPDVDCIFPMEL